LCIIASAGFDPEYEGDIFLRNVFLELHRVISQKILHFLVLAVRTSNTTSLNRFRKRLEKWLNKSAGIVAISGVASYMNDRQG
jgi:hypothetical protein